MEPEFLEQPREDGEAQGPRPVARPSREQLLLVFALFLGLFALSFATVTLFGSGGAAKAPGEPAGERPAEAPDAGTALVAEDFATEGTPGSRPDLPVPNGELHPDGFGDGTAGELDRESAGGAGEIAGPGDGRVSEEAAEGAGDGFSGDGDADMPDADVPGAEYSEDVPEADSGHERIADLVDAGQAAPVDAAADDLDPIDRFRAYGDQDAPLLALVIDDWGYGWEAAADILALEVPLNVAVIPHLPWSIEHASTAARNGHDVILHLPMEPENPAWDLGHGAVTTRMSDDEIAFEVRRALDSIPYISGINNHMGSKATQDERVMRAVLAVVKERGMFFLDSRTTPHSLVDAIAAEMGVPYLANDRFVDLDLNAARVRDAILRAADTARRRGWAIAIGHVHRATYQGIVAALPELRAKGVRLAYLSEILDKADPGRDAPLPRSLP